MAGQAEAGAVAQLDAVAAQTDQQRVRIELATSARPASASSYEKVSVTGFDAPARAAQQLRLQGAPSLDAAALDCVWRLVTPNKALGLTGVRAAYLIAPHAADAALLARLRALAPSWPLGAHGVALLQIWPTPDAQDWLQDCRTTLRAWKARQMDLLTAAGWRVESSDANFFVAARAGLAGAEGRFDMKTVLEELRRHGFKLRDCASFGLPGHVRLAVVAPGVQDALMAALRDIASKELAQ